ncbi:MAG: hypothetical protein IKJ75_00370 [Clostridia bacterium]|nr:hypothetical protein [Clostridia bacterium]
MSYRIRLVFAVVVFFIGICIVITDYILGLVQTTQSFLNILICLVAGCTAYYLPTFLGYLRKKSEKTKRRQELRFLKKIFVLAGSIKPVDFTTVIKTMIEKSYYYKQDLMNILEALRKSNLDREEFFAQLLEETKDIDSKLFFEKLNIAFFYDFDMAVSGISGDFQQEKRAHARLIKKKISLIHIIGITGLFIAMTILLIYMLKPWLESLDMSGI